MLNWRANKSCSRIRQIYCRAHKLSYKTICPSASRTSISVCRWVRIEAIFTSRSLEKIMKFSTWKMAEAVVIFRFRICPHFAILESSERPMDTSVILNKNTFRCRAFYISKYNKRRKTPLWCRPQPTPFNSNLHQSTIFDDPTFDTNVTVKYYYSSNVDQLAQ
jgi:hypothetical protein